jgi:hypothetical protein
MLLLPKASSAVGDNIDEIPDIFFLRYCLAYDGSSKKKGDINDAANALLENLQWRYTEGREICERASEAVKQATSNENNNKRWINAPVR